MLCLISGGGSSLLPLALSGLTLADKQALNKALLASGASSSEMNCVRRHLSAIKGGRLAAACAPARVVNLLLSDVPGDDPIDLESGPTAAARLNACKVEKRTFETAIEAANASEDATDTAASFLRSTTGKYWSVSGTTLGAGTETKPAGCS